MELNKLRLEDLQYKGLKFYQDPNLYCFTSDSVMLANFAKVYKKDKVCDFCAGGGIIPILVFAKNGPKSMTAVELQSQMFELLKLNIQTCGFDIKAINQDIVAFSKSKEHEEFDVITCNPPYKKQSEWLQPKNEVVAIARHEIKLNLDELLLSVKKSLKFGGRFYVCYDANRSAELIYKLKTNGLEPKRLFFTQPSSQKNATLVFVEAVKGGKEGIEVLPTLITNDKDGTYVQNIFDNYRRK